jgi:hypothetical protein
MSRAGGGDICAAARNAGHMTSPPVASQSAVEASTAPRRPLHRGALLSVVAIVVVAIVALLSGCGGGTGSTGSIDQADVGSVSGTLPADHGDASPGHCDGTIGGKTVDEVDVPSGAACTLEGTTVRGNVSIGHGGTLVARGVVVGGDVDGEGARLVEVSDNATIRGNLQLERGGASTVRDSEIRGDLRWLQQAGSLRVDHSRVSGNLQADQSSGGLTISFNRIGGDLECRQNSPAPASGDNTISGHRYGQCAPAARVTPRPKPPLVHQQPQCAGDSVSDDPSDDQCDAGGDN